MSEDEKIEYSESEDDDWKPEKAALAEILANQKRELAKLKKANKKHVKFEEDVEEEPAVVETPTIKQIRINGKAYNAIAGANGQLQYMDGKKLKKIRNKALYQEFLGNDEQPPPEEGEEDNFNGYEKYRVAKHANVQTTTNGSYLVPVANTQTFRQILMNTVIKDVWSECKEMLPQPGAKASATLKDKIKKQNMKYYNEALKHVINNVCLDAGLRNITKNRDALRAYVAEQIKDYNWCEKMKNLFKTKIEDLVNPTPNKQQK